MGKLLRLAQQLIEPYLDEIEPTFLDVTGQNIIRCLACDICPTHIGHDEEYRCIIPKDDLEADHDIIIKADAVVPVIYSSKDRVDVNSNYQRFMERTRYIRRGDYILSNRLVAPLIFEEVGFSENYAIRASTSY